MYAGQSVGFGLLIFDLAGGAGAFVVCGRQSVLVLMTCGEECVWVVGCGLWVRRVGEKGLESEGGGARQGQHESVCTRLDLDYLVLGKKILLFFLVLRSASRTPKTGKGASVTYIHVLCTMYRYRYVGSSN